MKEQKKGAVKQRDPMDHLVLICVLCATLLVVVFMVLGFDKLKKNSMETQPAMSSANVDIETEKQNNTDEEDAEEDAEDGAEASIAQAEESAEQSTEPEQSAEPAPEESTASAEPAEPASQEVTKKENGYYDFSKIAITKNPVDKNGPSYQKLYPELVVEPTEKTDDNKKKIVYLTFDDGPTKNTEKILDILEEYGVHATFFVSSQFGSVAERAERMNQILDSGNEIGLHTASHNYSKIYASIPAFLEDLEKIYQEVYEATGYRATLTRFPGGSVNQHNQKIAKELTAEVTRRGFTYHDWAVSVGDAEGKNLTAKTIVKSVAKECKKRTKSVVLFHDTDAQSETVKALPKLIESLLEDGYELRALDSSVRPFQM